MGRALVGPPGAIVGRVLVGPSGPPGPSWTGHLCAPWALMGRALTGPMGPSPLLLHFLSIIPMRKCHISMYSYKLGSCWGNLKFVTPAGQCSNDAYPTSTDAPLVAREQHARLTEDAFPIYEIVEGVGDLLDLTRYHYIHVHIYILMYIYRYISGS